MACVPAPERARFQIKALIANQIHLTIENITIKAASTSQYFDDKWHAAASVDFQLRTTSIHKGFSPIRCRTTQPMHIFPQGYQLAKLIYPSKQAGRASLTFRRMLLHVPNQLSPQ